MRTPDNASIVKDAYNTELIELIFVEKFVERIIIPNIVLMWARSISL